MCFYTAFILNQILVVRLCLFYRLSKDVAFIERTLQPRDFIIEQCDRPNSVKIKFRHPSESESSHPDLDKWRFLVEVPKYYPHDPPKVKYLGQQSVLSYTSRFINIADEVQHPLLLGEWKATSCLKTVIDVLRHIIREGGAPVTYHEGADEASGMMIA